MSGYSGGRGQRVAGDDIKRWRAPEVRPWRCDKKNSGLYDAQQVVQGFEVK